MRALIKSRTVSRSVRQSIVKVLVFWPEVVSSWMTRQDRDAAIADNVRYVDAAIAAVRASGSNDPIVYAGFSQGVAMAFRSAVLGRWPCAGVVAVGGDVPPELLEDRSLGFPAVLMLRGTRDEWHTQARFESDVESLTARARRIESVVFDGGHEWSTAASESAGTFLSSVQLSRSCGASVSRVDA